MRDLPRVALGALVALVSFSFLPRAASAADKPRVAYLGTEYLGSEIAGDHGGAQGLLDTAATTGVTSTAVTAVTLLPTEVPRGGDGHLCTGPSCIATASKISDADYFVRVDVRQDGGVKEKFFVKVQVLRASPFQVVVSDDSTCDECALVASLTNHVRYQVAGAMAKLIHEASMPAVATTSPAPATPSGSGPDSGPTHTSGFMSVGPYVLGGAGLIAVGAGALLWARGDQSECPGASTAECRLTYSDKKTGWLIGGVGLAAVAAAVVWWKLPVSTSSSTATSVAIGPGGASFFGSF